MKEKFIETYFEIAETFAKLSRAKRLKVGAIVVKDDRIISTGYNGTPTGWNNTCEDIKIAFDDDFREEVLITKPEVIHAEQNCLFKLARSNESGLGSTMFITHSPCVECSKGIYMSGIERLYYDHEYRSDSGIEFLKKCGIEVFRRIRERA
jgi:dCMP deaminase